MIELKVVAREVRPGTFVFQTFLVEDGNEKEITHSSISPMPSTGKPSKLDFEISVGLMATSVQGRLLELMPKEDK